MIPSCCGPRFVPSSGGRNAPHQKKRLRGLRKGVTVVYMNNTTNNGGAKMRTYRREGRVLWLGNTDTGHEFGHEFDTIREARKAAEALTDHPLYVEAAR